MTTLLKAGAVLEARTKNEETPLHSATANNENPAVVTTLLDAGADPKARAKYGVTAWDMVQQNDKLEDTDVYWRLNALHYE